MEGAEEIMNVWSNANILILLYISDGEECKVMGLER